MFNASETFLSKRRIKLASIAAFLGCVACCTVPLLAVFGIGGGAAVALSKVFHPGYELVVGATVFVTALVAMAVLHRMKAERSAGCGTSCDTRGDCCDRGA